MTGSTQCILTVFACFSFTPTIGLADIQLPVADARYVAVAGATTAIRDFSGSGANPASVPVQRGIRAGFSVRREFSMKALQTAAAEIALPVGSSTVALSINRFGYDAFASTTVGVQTGLRLLDQLYAGIRIRTNHVRIGSYGSYAATTFSVGWIYEATRTIAIGAALLDVAKLGSPNAGAERSIDTGISVGIPGGPRVLASLIRSGGHVLDTRFGLEADVTRILSVRLGVTGSPRFVSGGLGLQTKLFRFDFAYALHNVLGGSPALSLIVGGQ